MPIFRTNPGLLERFRAGSREAMETVYRAYVRRIEALLRAGFAVSLGRKVPGVAAIELEDLVQEVFAKAFSERARLAFDGKRDYGPFLSTLARNVVVDWARKRHRQVALDDFPEITEKLAETSAEEPWAEPDALRVVEAYLRSLPENLAAVHRERYVLGHTQKEAAEALGLSRQQLRTCEDHLREGLDRALHGSEEKHSLH